MPEGVGLTSCHHAVSVNAGHLAPAVDTHPTAFPVSTPERSARETQLLTRVTQLVRVAGAQVASLFHDPQSVPISGCRILLAYIEG